MQHPYPIDKDVPIPPKASQRQSGGRPKTPLRMLLDALEIGDSFLVPEPEEKDRVWNMLPHAVPMKFTIRKVPREGWRVWRVA